VVGHDVRHEAILDLRFAIYERNKKRLAAQKFKLTFRPRFMEDLLVVILQCVFEFLLEIFCYSPLDWLPWDWPEGLFGKYLGCFIMGCGLAGISILLFKYTWISHPLLRMVNLVFAPIASAFISQVIARYRSRKNRSLIPRNSFWQAFWFTFGIVLIRFVYATRR
jgi:hypothetical protein